MSGFRVEAERSIAAGRFLALNSLQVRSPDGDRSEHDVVRHPGGLAVLPVDGESVWFISQYRSAFDTTMIEVPAGKREATDTDPIDGARRELREEIGATARVWVHLASMVPSPGYTDEVIEVFAADGLEFGDRAPEGAPEEHATVFAMPLSEALDSIQSGRITDAKTIVALLEWNRRQQ